MAPKMCDYISSSELCARFYIQICHNYQEILFYTEEDGFHIVYRCIRIVPEIYRDNIESGCNV